MRVLVTGTTQGIGYEIVQKLKENADYEIFTINRRETENNEHNIICDLSNISQVESICSVVRELQIDILINNAGGSSPMRLEDLTATDIMERINLNFVAPTLLMQAVIPHMKGKKYGRIINISSVTGKTPVPYLHIYGAAKAALDNVMQSTACYLSNTGITVNNICPGSVKTDVAVYNRGLISNLHGNETAEYQNEMENGNSLGRMILPSEVANFACFLISDGASAINGQSINVCGTMEIH